MREVVACGMLRVEEGVGLGVEDKNEEWLSSKQGRSRELASAEIS
jgi:hypothetical protein